MNSHTKKVAAVGFAGLAIFSAVVLFFPLAYRILPEVLQESKPFTLAYSIVSVCWMLAVAVLAIKSTMDADSQAWREYYDSLPGSGDRDDGDDEGDDEDESAKSLATTDSELGKATWQDPDTGLVRSVDVIPCDSTAKNRVVSVGVDPDALAGNGPGKNPEGKIQVFRVPGGTLKPGM